MKEFNVRYAYHRPDLYSEEDKEAAVSMGVELRPLTVAYRKVGAGDTVTSIDCAISICNVKDNFEKAKGREFATKRLLEKDPVWTFTISNDKMFVLLAQSSLDPFEAINENFAPLLLSYMKHSAIQHFVVAQAMEHITEKGL